MVSFWPFKRKDLPESSDVIDNPSEGRSTREKPGHDQRQMSAGDGRIRYSGYTKRSQDLAIPHNHIGLVIIEPLLVTWIV